MIKVQEDARGITITGHANTREHCAVFSFIINIYMYLLENNDAIAMSNNGYVRIDPKMISRKEYNILNIILTQYNINVEPIEFIN